MFYTSKKKPCTQPKICGYCSEDAHLTNNETCANQKKCINCQKTDHPAWSRDCPKYQEEAKIWRKATEERVSYKWA